MWNYVLNESIQYIYMDKNKSNQIINILLKYSHNKCIHNHNGRHDALTEV